MGTSRLAPRTTPIAPQPSVGVALRFSEDARRLTAYSYLRFSTPEQAAGDSFRRQTRLAEDYAATHGMALDCTLSLSDLGVSAFHGANASSGNLGAFRRAIEQGVVPSGSFLLVESLDRLSRATARKALRLIEEIVEAGVTVVTLTDGRQYTAESLDGMDLMWALMVMIRANEESEIKSRRQKAAWRRKRQNLGTETFTRTMPAWIRLDAERRRVLIPERADVVRSMIRWTVEGMGRVGIARLLNEQRLQPFGRAKYWYRSYIDKILVNPALMGTFIPRLVTYKDDKLVRFPLTPVPDYFPAVIDADTFAQLQTIVLGSPRRGNRALDVVRNVLSGLGRCPLCGGRLIRMHKHRHSRAKLVCARAKIGAGCRLVKVNLAAIECALIQHADLLLSEMPSPDVTVPRELSRACGAVDELEERLQSLTRVLLDTPSRTLAEQVAAHEHRLFAARSVRDSLRERAGRAEMQYHMLRTDELRAALSGTPVAIGPLNAALRTLVEGAIVDHTTGRLVLRWRLGGATSLTYGLPAPPWFGAQARAVP